MIEDIRAITAEATRRIDATGTLDDLAVAEREVLGKASALTGFKRQMGALDADARREVGAALNAARSTLEAAVVARRD